MTRKVTLILMGVGWIVGFLIAAVPVLFNRWDSAAECEFDEIFHSWYMAGVITPMFSAVWFCMICVLEDLEGSSQTSETTTDDWITERIIRLEICAGKFYLYETV